MGEQGGAAWAAWLQGECSPKGRRGLWGVAWHTVVVPHSCVLMFVLCACALVSSRTAPHHPGVLSRPAAVSLQDCDIYLVDFCGQVTVDECKNCRIFVGPTEGRWGGATGRLGHAGRADNPTCRRRACRLSARRVLQPRLLGSLARKCCFVAAHPSPSTVSFSWVGLFAIIPAKSPPVLTCSSCNPAIRPRPLLLLRSIFIRDSKGSTFACVGRQIRWVGQWGGCLDDQHRPEASSRQVHEGCGVHAAGRDWGRPPLDATA